MQPLLRRAEELSAPSLPDSANSDDRFRTFEGGGRGTCLSEGLLVCTVLPDSYTRPPLHTPADSVINEQFFLLFCGIYDQ